MSKVKPILFSIPMVQAIIAGRKTVTRRVIKPQPEIRIFIGNQTGKEVEGWQIPGTNQFWQTNDTPETSLMKTPFQPGDILYVREPYFQVGHWEPDNDPKKKRKNGRQAWKFVPDAIEIRYSNNPPPSFRKGRHKESPEVSTWHKRLGRFMPKSAARIWLEVVSVRPESLQDITEEDAVREGVEPNCPGDVNKCPSSGCKSGCQSAGEYFHYMRDGDNFPAFSAIESFESLWESINGAESWDANPWVWRIEFTTLSTTGKPSNILR